MYLKVVDDFFNTSTDKSFKILGISTLEEYASTIKTIINKCEKNKNSVFFSNNIPLKIDSSLINYVKIETNKFNFNALENEEIVLCNNSLYSSKIKKSLITNWTYVLNSPLFLNIEYINDNIKKNVFISILIALINILSYFEFNNAQTH